MTVKRARELLGDELKTYSDEKVQDMINSLEVLADIAIETFKKLTPEQRREWIKKPKKQQHVK